MKPVFQTEFYDPENPDVAYGNCLQACVASLFELEIDEVPRFEGSKQFFDLTRWLRTRNVGVSWMQEIRYFMAPYIRSGKSPRGNWHHAVIYDMNNLLHDPHPDGTGIEPEEVDPHGMYYFYVLDPSKQVKVNAEDH